MPTVEERLDALEARAAADTITPNYLTIDPVTGLVSANFSGIVNAGGLNLTQPQLIFGGIPPIANRLRWLRALDHTARTTLLSGDHPITDVGPRVENTFQAIATSPDGNGSATLEADADNTGVTNKSRVIAGADADQVTVLQAGGASGFLAIAAAAAAGGALLRQIDWGQVVLTWPGGSPDSTALTVAHVLGRVPRIVVLTSDSAVVPFYSALTAADFAAHAETNNLSSPAAGFTVNVSWLAIG